MQRERFEPGYHYTEPRGYVLVKLPEGHHLRMASGYGYQHRLVAEKALGRRLRRGEDVHHKDGNRENCRPWNLRVVGHAEHAAEHAAKKQRNTNGQFV